MSGQPPEEVLDHLLAGLPEPRAETLPLDQAAGRVLLAPAAARRPQPPFDAARMDGYALKSIEAEPEAMFRLIGEAAAGAPFPGRVGPGECVRIFTGAPLPEGADRVVMQEEASQRGTLVTLARQLSAQPFIRPAGSDLAPGASLPAGRLLGPADLALLAAMDIAQVTVARRPEVAILATGSELAPPGSPMEPAQIPASNPVMLAALMRRAGARPRLLDLTPDDPAALATTLDLARGADLIVTTGGAAQGEHDLVEQVVGAIGGQAETRRVALRPGKRLITGQLHGAPFLGLPGVPGAALAAAAAFAVPMVRALSGLPARQRLPAPLAAPLEAAPAATRLIPARLTAQGLIPLAPGALFNPATRPDALIWQPAHTPARALGETVEYLPI